jgi:hypothetical protein
MVDPVDPPQIATLEDFEARFKQLMRDTREAVLQQAWAALSALAIPATEVGSRWKGGVQYLDLLIGPEILNSSGASVKAVSCLRPRTPRGKYLVIKAVLGAGSTVTRWEVTDDHLQNEQAYNLAVQSFEQVNAFWLRAQRECAKSNFPQSVSVTVTDRTYGNTKIFGRCFTFDLPEDGPDFSLMIGPGGNNPLFHYKLRCKLPANWGALPEFVQGRVLLLVFEKHYPNAPQLHRSRADGETVITASNLRESDVG